MSDASGCARPLDPSDEAYRYLWHGLKNRHRGEAAAITKPRLVAALAEAGHPVDRRVLDETLRAMRAAGFPVAATAAGVFWARTRDELLRARHTVAARFDDLRETVDAYDRLIGAWAVAPDSGGVVRTADGQGMLFGGASIAPGSRT
jgi:hypothetical protein